MTDLDRALALWGQPQETAEAGQEGLFRPDDRPKLLALCDSWGAIPPEWLVFGPPSNIVAWLREWERWNITALTENGGELCAFLSGSRKLKLCELLDREHFDAFFLSGGGNDFLGQYDMAGMVKPRAAAFIRNVSLLSDQPDIGYNEGLFTPMFFRVLRQMGDSILNLLDWIDRSKLNNGLPVAHHTYDFVVPSDRGATFLGGRLKFQGGRSWLKPYLDALGWIDPTEQRMIIRRMLLEFKAMLRGIEREVSHYHVVDTQGTLDLPTESEDEIHATSEGFRKIAQSVEARLLEVSLRPVEKQEQQGD